MVHRYPFAALVGVAVLSAGCGGNGTAVSGSTPPGSASTAISASNSIPTSPTSPSSDPSTRNGLISVADAAAQFPELQDSTVSKLSGPMHVIGVDCGQVPSEEDEGPVLPQAPPATVVRIAVQQNEALASTAASESVVRFADVAAAVTVLRRYRDYLDRCADRRHGGRFDGTVSSTGWALSGLGDDAVGMVDDIDVRNYRETQRTAVIRAGRMVIVLRVTSDTPHAPDPIAARQLAATALDRAGAD
jgi:hypothetical protein